jgi:aldehyde dehydrogenase
MIDERKIEEIVARVMERLGGVAAAPARAAAPAAASASAGPNIPRGTLGVYADPAAAAAAARRGFEANERLPVGVRAKMIAAMRAVTLANLEQLSQFAVEETGLGRYADKLGKNRLVAEKTPGLEILRPVAFTGDDGLMLTERAPYGVILAVTPTTNPTETILCNAIGMVAGGNSVIFNVHPSAGRTSNWFVHLLNEAIIGAGGPQDVLVSIEKPTVDSAQALMVHPLVRLVVVTGGPAVVKQAMASGKKVIAAGPGNPPAVVDATANLDKAAAAIVSGASLDNNIVCIAEKEIIAVDAIAGELLRRLQANKALLLDAAQVKALEKVVLEGDHVNKAWVGKDAGKIAAAIGLSGHGQDLRILTVRGRRAAPVRAARAAHAGDPAGAGASDVADAIAMALRVEHGFHHTATMHSLNIDHMAAMARVCNCQHLRQERRLVRRPGPRRRGLHLVHDRQPDRRGPDHRRALHARAPLHAQRSVPVRVSRWAAGPALGILELATIARGIVVADAALKRAPTRAAALARGVGRQAPGHARGRGGRGRRGDARGPRGRRRRAAGVGRAAAGGRRRCGPCSARRRRRSTGTSTTDAEAVVIVETATGVCGHRRRRRGLQGRRRSWCATCAWRWTWLARPTSRSPARLDDAIAAGDAARAAADRGLVALELIANPSGDLRGRLFR